MLPWMRETDSERENKCVEQFCVGLIVPWWRIPWAKVEQTGKPFIDPTEADKP